VSQAHPVRVLVATHETLRRRAQMAAGEVARLVAGQFPDHLLNPEIAAHKEAAS
jgi:hypothetical protein